MSNSMKRIIAAMVAVVGLMTWWAGASPAGATVIDRDDVLFNTPEAKFGLIINPITGNADFPGVVQWDLNTVSPGEWTPILSGQLANEGLAAGECVRLRVDYFDGSIRLNNASEFSGYSCGTGPDLTAVHMDDFSDDDVNRVRIRAQVGSGASYSTVGTINVYLF